MHAATTVASAVHKTMLLAVIKHAGIQDFLRVSCNDAWEGSLGLMQRSPNAVQVCCKLQCHCIPLTEITEVTADLAHYARPQ